MTQTNISLLITPLVTHLTNLISHEISACKKQGKVYECCKRMHLKQFFNRPVVSFVSAGLMNLNDDEDMLEVRADGLWSEGQGAWLLEHDCHNVITDVSLPQQLMEQNRDTEIH